MPRLLFFVLLAAAASIPYARVWTLGFTNFDDPEYVTQNPRVRTGLTWSNAAWAFTSTEQANWHPLTWISHMADCGLYGLKPAGHHVTNLIFHVISTLLLFWSLCRMTRAPGRSAFAAALFALHPLHVESVAWIAERKDVFSALFWMLALAAYLRYVESARLVKGLWVVLWMAMGLACKPMLVTLPFALLLLDIWPLGRFRSQARRKGERDLPLAGPLSAFSFGHRAVLEKIPLVLLSAVSSIVTYLVQQQGGAVVGFQRLPFSERLANAAVSYADYARKAVWPAGLAPFYPLPDAVPWGAALASAAALCLVSWFAIRLLRQRPYLAVGWFWFLGTLVPVIGLVQVGNQALADRYTYIPLIGLFVIAAWGVYDLAERFRMPRLVPVVAAVAASTVLAVLTWAQTGYWKSSETLFRHTIAVTGDNQRAYLNLGAALAAENRTDEAIAVYRDILSRRPDDAELLARLAMMLALQGKNQEAIEYYRRALMLNPGHPEAQNGLGYALSLTGAWSEALEHHREALRLKPDFPEARYNLGKVYAAQGNPQQALEQFDAALKLKPEYFEVHERMALLLANQGRMSEALPHFSSALQIRPQNADLRYRYAIALYRNGSPREAIAQLTEVIRIKPDWVEALDNLAWILATHDGATAADGTQAVEYARKAMALLGKPDASKYDTLAAALARGGRFEEAVTTVEDAMRLAKTAGNSSLATDMDQRRVLYRAKQAYTDK